MECLPEECVAHVLSCLSPRDVCWSSEVCSAIRDAAQSELLWEKLLPPDYRQIVSAAVSPVKFSSRKDLFIHLWTTPLLIDGGCKEFSIHNPTGRKRYILSATGLYIAWSANPHFWCWKPHAESRFPEVVELITVSWLEIQGKISTRMLSPNTHYEAYLIVHVGHRAYGLDTLPSEVSIEVGSYRSRGTVVLSLPDRSKQSPTSCDRVVVRATDDAAKTGEIHEREDGWSEIKLGEFYNEGVYEEEVKMSLKEVNGPHLKGGLIVEGIEVRPK